MSTIPRYRIFPNGTSYMVWMESNCERCVKSFDASKHLAKRLNWDGQSYLNHNCPEFVP